MVYLEYHLETGKVRKIYDYRPECPAGYDYCKSNIYKLKDEYEETITVLQVDENRNLIRHSSYENTEAVTLLLKENDELKAKVANLQNENEHLKTDLGNALLESASDKARIAELETTSGALLLEVATLKSGGNDNVV